MKLVLFTVETVHLDVAGISSTKTQRITTRNLFMFTETYTSFEELRDKFPVLYNCTESRMDDVAFDRFELPCDILFEFDGRQVQTAEQLLASKKPLAGSKGK